MKDRTLLSKYFNSVLKYSMIRRRIDWKSQLIRWIELCWVARGLDHKFRVTRSRKGLFSERDSANCSRRTS